MFASCRLFIFLMLGLLTFGTASQEARAAEVSSVCLSEAEVRDAVMTRVVVPQIQALRTARAETGGEAVGASLCRMNDALIYVITTLTRDGKLRRVYVQGVTGRTLEGLN